MTALGLMEGKQKLFYLPEPAIDFIYAEELGLMDGADRYIFGWGGDCERYCRARRLWPLPAVGVTTGASLQHQRGAGAAQ